ncbi:hypothetical protein [Methylobacter sp.]|uniref:hypothetical protein n=1 Tax=Methylobacter sp. TaxID=2051955 RepID=UPI0011F8FE7F|nr:hypothetical protein [Methylobacter sp.]TAK59521.1 MAG: hypothetical protein EPO18_20380 [Methylobacter sp.]
MKTKSGEGDESVVKPRHLPDVIDKILKALPKNHEAREGLEDLKESAMYTAPEAMRDRWLQLSAVLNDKLSWPPKLAWECLVDDIVAGRK